MLTLSDIINYLAIFIIENWKVIFNFVVLSVLIYAWVISEKSANIRWLIGVVVLSKAIDASIGPWIINWGIGYYILISALDGANIYLIAKRKTSALFIAQKKWPVISYFSRKAVDNYKLTSNEIAFIFISAASISANILNMVVRLIRHNSEYNPMFIYNYWPSFKFALSILMLFVLVSVAIDAKRGYYNGNKESLKG